MSQYGVNSNLEYAEEQIDNIVILKLRITELTGKQSSNWNDN